ncbi:LuxR C-terminal-related transcriptional regulator [Solirubrobacter ginsenosidimutans]|uniref:LuxR C-terminal-related transcriptional regulator n=1 Tax=Solirubrobacter ginsenosidimutans TaxID=490573 RepID=UPI0022CDEDBF|nr:LuxR C-terminal-related transcriptional regulator [Solirubrobacter ginsenosidimutans]
MSAALVDQRGGAVVEHLLEDLGSIETPLWLVIDDLHELHSLEALRDLALLAMRAAPELRFVLSTRGELPLGLHRLWLEGALTEVRADDLRFSLDEARTLFDRAGVQLSERALVRLYERTEGWCAGLRLAALSLVGHPEPERFAAEFCGSERTVAAYLLAEVLERQPEDVKQLLLRTSILERVNGPLADRLTGDSGGERVLQELEQEGAFVVSLNAQRSWFRYHALFADLLQLELRRTAPALVAEHHGTAASWFARHKFPIEAIRHAQAAEHWTMASRMLCDHCLTLRTGGQWATAQALLARFPDDVIAADAELPLFLAVDEMLGGSLVQAERMLARASDRSASLPVERRRRLQARVAVLHLWVALRRCDPPAVVAEAGRLLGPIEAPDSTGPRLNDELRAMALSCHGIGDLWRGQYADAEPYLEQARELAHRTGQCYVKVSALAYSAVPLMYRSFMLARETCAQAIDEAHQHGWDEAPIAGIAHTVRGVLFVWQGHLDEAQRWLDIAQRTVRAEAVPAVGLWLRLARGQLELARGRDHEALTALTAAVHFDDLLATRHPMAGQTRGLMLQAMLRLGDADGVERALAKLDGELREGPELRKATAALRLAQDDAEAATEALAPVIDGSAPVVYRAWLVEAFILEALARETLGDAGATGRALERALDLAEPDGALWPFLLHPAPELLARHARHHTTHSALVREIRSLLSGRLRASPLDVPEPLLEPLSESETRLLRYLPTNLSVPEIAEELYVAASTAKTHVKHIYGKLGVHSRAEAVERARALGLLAPSSLERR